MIVGRRRTPRATTVARGVVEVPAVPLAVITPAAVVPSHVAGATVNSPHLAPNTLPLQVSRTPAAWSSQRHPEVPAWVAAWSPPADAYGPCPTGGTHLRLILDESGSVQGADPIRYRHDLLDRLCASLGSACTCGQCRVSVTMFGITEGRAQHMQGPERLKPKPGSLLRDLPGTGSYLGPAVTRVDQLGDDGNAITVCLTDLEIFDADPDAEVVRLQDQPHPLLLLLGSAAQRAQIPPDLDTVAVTQDSEPTAVADNVARHITTVRSAAAPGQSRGGGSSRKPGHPATRKGCAPILVALPLLALAAATVLALLPDSPKSDGAAGGVTVSPSVDSPGAPAQPTDTSIVPPGGYLLPGLTGNAPRTIPTQTTLWVDPTMAANPAQMLKVREELPAVIDYQNQYLLAGDTLAMDPTGDLPINAPDLKNHASDLNPTAIAPEDLPQLLRDLPTVAAGAERAVMILTDRPSLWLQTLPSMDTADSIRTPSTNPRQAVQFYLLDTSTTAPVPRDLAETGPWVIPTGGTAPGAVAVAATRAWGHTVGATWLG